METTMKDTEKLSRVHDEPYEPHRVIRDHEVYRHDNRPIVSIFAPFLQTAFTDWFHAPFDLQADKICGRIERNFYKCLSAYGSNRGFTECRNYIDDYRECTSFEKQRQRLKEMIKERRRKIKTGEFKEYSKPPRMGSYESTEY